MCTDVSELPVKHIYMYYNWQLSKTCQKFGGDRLSQWVVNIPLMAFGEENTILPITYRRNNIFSKKFSWNKDRSKVYLAIVKYFFPKMLTFGVGCYLNKVPVYYWLNFKLKREQEIKMYLSCCSLHMRRVKYYKRMWPCWDCKRATTQHERVCC